METLPREGVLIEEKFPNNRKPSHRWVCGEFWNLGGQHKSIKPTDYMPNGNSQQRNSPDAHIHHQQAGAE